MVPENTLSETRRNQRIVWLSPKLSMTTSWGPLHLICAVIWICAGAFSQNPALVETTPDEQARIECEARVVDAKATAPFKLPDNIQDGTKAALACEWIDPNAVQQVLKAMKLLTSDSPNPLEVNVKVLRHLMKFDPYSFDQGLYQAAMGVPDADGRPTVQGLPNFLDTLAKANTLGLRKPQGEDALFGETTAIIGNIFEPGRGKLALAKVHDSFIHKYNYSALYQLLNAAWQQSQDVGVLNRLRAAFEMNSDRLAKQVAAKIAPEK